MAPALARYEREAWTPTDTGLCAMPMIQPADDDFRICQISFKTLLHIQLEAERLGLATRWSSADALRSQVREDAVVLQSLMREERQGAVRSYRCLVLFAMAGGSASGGLATIDVAPARYESLQRLDQEPEVSQAFFRLFTLATGGISMVCKL